MWPFQHRGASSDHRHRIIALPLAIALIASSVSLVANPATIGPARAADPVATTTTLDAIPAQVISPVSVTAHVSPAPQPVDGFIPALHFEVDGNVAAAAPFQGDGLAPEHLTLPIGTYEIVAVWGGNANFAASQSAPQTVEVIMATATSLTSSLNPASSPQAVTLTAYVTNTSTGTLDGGTLTITDTTPSPDVVLGTKAVGPGPTTLEVTTTTLSVGDHTLRADYSGNGPIQASSSTDLIQSILPDQAVDADSFKASPATFYPVKDGYRDLLAISGRTNEPATVTVRIYSVSTGQRVRSLSLGTKSGAYTWNWNGRTASGTMVAAGKYRIVQTVVDAGSNTLTSTLYANLSLKKLVWKTVTKTQDGDDYVIKGTGGSGWVRQGSSSYARGVRISSGSSWAGVGYAFPSPSGAVYKNVKFQVLGRSPNSRRAVIAIWAPAFGGYRNLDNYDYAALIGPSYKWWSTTAPLKSHRGGGKIRTTVAVGNDGSVNTFDIAKVRVTYTYGVLK